MQIDTATTTFHDSKIDPNIHTDSLRICSYTPRFQRTIRRISQSHVICVKFRGFVLTTSGRLPRLFPIKLSSHKDPNSKYFGIFTWFVSLS